MFTRAQSVKNLPRMHCHLAYFPLFLFQHNNGQQEAIDFISNWHDLQWFKLLGSAAMQMYGDLYVAQKGSAWNEHFAHFLVKSTSLMSDLKVKIIKILTYLDLKSTFFAA